MANQAQNHSAKHGMPFMWCIVIPGGAATVDLDPVRKLLARVSVARAGLGNLEAVEVALSGAGARNTRLHLAKIKRLIRWLWPVKRSREEILPARGQELQGQW